jgi:hypothetical protein
MADTPNTTQGIPIAFNKTLAELVRLNTGRIISPNDPALTDITKDGKVTISEFASKSNYVNSLKLPLTLYRDILIQARREKEIRDPGNILSPARTNFDECMTYESDARRACNDTDSAHPALTHLNIAEYVYRLKQVTGAAVPLGPSKGAPKK